MSSQTFKKEQYLYTPLFCEENIWQLGNTLASQSQLDIEKSWVLVITNPEQKVPLMNQQVVEPGQAVIWDYHVILLSNIDSQLKIFDFDTRLPFVTPLELYIASTFIEPDKLPESFHPYIRKIPLNSYLKNFYSDRSHMTGQIDSADFPAWPIINQNQEHIIKLADYLSLGLSLGDDSEILKPESLSALIIDLTEDYP